MPIKKASMKDLKKSKKRQARNLIAKKALRSEEKKIAKLIASNDTAKLKTQMHGFFSELDKAVNKKLLHKNKASRKKSRYLAKISKMLKAGKK